MNPNISTNASLGDHYESFLPLVRRIARTYRLPSPAAIEPADLVQEGCIGVLTGIRYHRTHHPDAPIEPAYLAQWANKYIHRAVRRYAYPFSLPERQEDGEEVVPQSVDAPLGEDEDGNSITIGDVLGGSDDVEAEMNQQQLHDMLSKRIERLSAREQYVVRHSYGFDREQLTTAQIAKNLGIPIEHARKIRERAILLLICME